MSEFNTELEDEFESEFDDEDDNLEELVSDDEDDQDDEETAARQGSRNRNRPDPTAVLKSELAATKADLADYKKRLGDQVRISGERLKERDAELDTWFGNADTWLQTEAAKQYHAGYEQGKKDVENDLLDRLMPDEKSDYLVAERRNPRTPPQPNIPAIQNNRKQRMSQTATEDLSDIVAEFTAQGVPLDEIDQTSAKAVVSSGTKWLRESAKTEVAQTERRVRDESGATRVSSGGGGVRNGQSADQKALAEINQRLKELRGKPGADRRAPQLLKQKKTLESRINASRRAA